MRFHSLIVSAVAALMLALPIGDAGAVPIDGAFGGLPDRFRTHEFTLGSRALGETCYSRARMPDGSICNPAYLGEATDSGILIRAFIGNGFAALTTADKFVFKSIDRSTLQQMFTAENVTSVEANLGLYFSTPHFNGSFEPYRMQFFSEAHNPNLPVVAVHAAIERAFTFGAGTNLGKWVPALSSFDAGVKLRFIERNFVHGSFSLFSVLAYEPRVLLPVQQQKAAYIEPTVGWTGRDLIGSPRVSATVRRVGFVSDRSSLYPSGADLTLAGGVSRVVGPGELALGLDATDVFTSPSLGSTLHFGASYRYGIIEALAGWNSDVINLGTQLSFQVLQVGVSYEFDRKAFYAAGAGQRISTEFGIRF